MKQNQHGFTLTELLIVVLMIGILASVVLPKFTKTIDSFRVLEAEHIVGAIRNDQEKRCMLDKKYTQNPTRLSVIPSDVSVEENVFTHGDFSYTLLPSGMTVVHNVKNYTLEMPSYTDGRICCDNCGESLNKNYPVCADLEDSFDYQEAAAECL